VFEVDYEKIAMSDTVLQVSQGGVRRWPLTNTRDEGFLRRYKSRRIFWDPDCTVDISNRRRMV
jgi:hypothetical protein